MCGICGVVQLGGAPREVVARETLDWMTDVMTHRGPSDRGIYYAPGIALGVRRLSIVDVEGGHQPMASEDERIWAIQNGELYNHADLRARLTPDGHVFRTTCDTEILPHLYERFGPDYPAELRGKFATAVWDEGRRRAVIARDRLGVKPLYYAVRGDLLVFASELKSVLASGLIEPEVDPAAIHTYLTLGFVPAPATPLVGVHKLLPGYRLVADADGARPERYWAYPMPREDGPVLDEREYAERLLAEVDEAVRLRLMSDVPLGAMLSGGLDSSLVVALMARHADGAVKTFSVGFAEAKDANELADARHVSQVFGTDHHELELSLSEQSLDLEDLVWHLDEPLADFSSLGFHALCELAARHVTVALAGQGADELLAGYQKYRVADALGRTDRIPGLVRGPVLAATARLGPARARRLARLAAIDDPAARLAAMSTKVDDSILDALLIGNGDGGAVHAAFADRLGGLGHGLPAALTVDGQLALADDLLHYFDRVSMGQSLEVRVPFLDHRVVEYCQTIPSGLKLRGGTTKYLLKQVARGIVPDRIIDKPKIGFLSEAVDDWFRAQSTGVAGEYLFRQDAPYAEFVSREGVRDLADRHARMGGHAEGWALFAVLLLEIWLSTYLPRAMAPAPKQASAAVGG